MNDSALIEYYRRRAREYERIYEKPERQSDLERLQQHLRSLLSGHRVLEMACGTGWWTAAIAGTVESVYATDVNEEVLEIARAKGLDPARVTFARADAFDPGLPHREFDAGFAAFWWSHVPKTELSAFLHAMHSAMRPGARIVFVDNLQVPGSSTPVSRTDAKGNSFQWRRLDDGSVHEVLKNFPTTDELLRVLGPHSDLVEVKTFEFFWCASYELRVASNGLPRRVTEPGTADPAGKEQRSGFLPDPCESTP